METNRPSLSHERRSLSGLLSFWAAVIASGSAAMIGFTSFTPFNPPDWLRIATMAPLPLALILAVGFGLVGLKQSTGRGWAIAGLVLAGLSVVAFIVMISIGG